MLIHRKVHTIPQNHYEVREFPNGKAYYTWCDGEDYFHHYEITEPQDIISDIKQCEKDLLFNKRMKGYTDFVKNSKIFLNEKIFGIVGCGGLTTVFDIGDERVLKISKENPFEYRQYNPKFDIPLLSNVVHSGNLYGYIQQKAEVDSVDYFNVKKVKRKMKRAGYTPSEDFGNHRTEQVGISNGKSYLLDSRCAIIQNDFKTRFADWFKKWFDRSPLIVVPVDDTSDLPPTHIDEKPKANYTKAEVKTIFKEVFDSWKFANNFIEKAIHKGLKITKFI